MPGSTRQWAQRKCESAVNNIEWAQQHLLDIVNTYEPQHPKIAIACNTLMELAELLKKEIDSLRVKI